MFLILELRDDEEKCHRAVRLEFEAQATIQQLRDKIQFTFQILPEMQQVVDSNNRRIDLLVGTIESAGIQDNETLIVKHAHLGIFAHFEYSMDSTKKEVQKKRDHKAKEYIKLAFKQLTILNESDFFSAYTSFHSRFREFNENYASYLDTDDDQLKKAAEFYFALFFKDDPQNPLIRTVFSSKFDLGSQGGLICSVKRSEEILGNYYLKSHLGLSSKTPSGHQAVDLRELLIYKLLQLLGIGPVVHFLPNVHMSCFGLYIATEEVPGFRRADKVVMPTYESYKLDILREIFYLIDLRSNNSNYGLNKDDKLCIVDFQIGNHARSIKSSLRSYLKSNERIELYKTCMRDWRLLDMVQSADEQISLQKQLLKERSIFARASDDYKDYRQKISENIQFASEILQDPR
ncbi:hypothetical protein M3Y98_00379700 [Aphelenchoides besseyi]|nr:hypothetical protein M3Y98_00379700 [Aphelenchoides besseyi]